MRWIVIGLAITVGLPMAAFLTFYIWMVAPFYFDSCGYEPTGVEFDLDNETRVVVLEVNCGATTSTAEWVVIQHGIESLGPDNDRLVSFEGEVVELEWEHGLLTVHYREDPGRSHQVFDPLSEYADFRIEYLNDRE